MPPAPSTGPAPVAFETYVPALSNRYFWWDCCKTLGIVVPVIGIGILGVIFYDEDFGRVPGALSLMGVACGVLLGLIALICLVFFPLGFPRRFRIDWTGVLWESRSGPGGSAVGVFAGNPQVRGSSLLSRSTHPRKLSWKDIRSVHCHSATGVLCFLNSWRVVVRVYCPPYAYEAAVEAARAYAACATTPPIRVDEA